MDAKEVQKAFKTVSKEYSKYEVPPSEYHVTTEYKPDLKHEDLYGLPVIIHITGSYTYAAKYTGQLDFSDVTPVDLTIKSVFGLADSEGKLILE